jgi:hypothetical protein
MPLVPGVMCSLCFATIYDGEHWTDEEGQRWDSHAWCDLVDQAHSLVRDATRLTDQALAARAEAAQRRALNGQPPIED